MATFKATTYDATSTAYNALAPVYIDGTTPTVPCSGLSTYSGAFGNVMAAFALDGGDAVLGGNAIVARSLNLVGGLTAITSPNTTTARSTYTLYYPVPIISPVYRYSLNVNILNYASGTGVSDATSNAAAVYNTASFATGAGGSYSFTGGAYATSNWITLPAFTRTSAMTMCIWYNTSNAATYSRFFDYGTTMRLCILNTNLMSFNDTVQFTASTTFNTWNHVAVTVNGTSVIVYANGVQTATGTLNAAMSGSSIGYLGHSYGGDPNYVGMMNDYRVYLLTLTASQILAIYNKTI